MPNEKHFIVRLTALALIVILIFLVMGYAVIRQGINALNDEKINYLEEISYKTAQNIKENIEGHISTVVALSTFVGNYGSYSTESILEILKIEAVQNDFKRIGIASPDGMAITTDDVVFDLSDRSYFQLAMKGTACVSDRLLIDKVDGKEINVIAVPVYHGDEVASVIFATKKQEDFAEMMNIESFRGEGYSYIITADGYPVVKTTHASSIGDYDNLFDAMTTKGISETDRDMLRNSIAQGKSGSLENHRNGEKRQLCFTSVGINDWYLISVVPAAVISSQSDQLIINLIIFILLIVFVTGLCSSHIIMEMKRKNQKLQTIAYTDKITGYANWDRFLLDVGEALKAPNSGPFAILSLDVNKFKVLNDLLGRKAGDATLKAVADVLYSKLTPPETFCRASLDKFSLLIQYETEQDIIGRVERFSEMIGNLIKDYKIEISVGIHHISGEGATIETLNDRANIARIAAKQRNDIVYSFFDKQSQIALLKEKEIENVMHKSLEAGEFEVYLQPKYSLQTGEMIGAEALSRWNRKGTGLVQPIDFIPLFEKNGFIRKLDAYMLRQVCALLSKWDASPNHRVVPISINLSRVELSDEQLPQKLLNTINEYGVNISLLEFELTESGVCDDFEHVKDVLQKIRKIGARISIDDFGNGYSSFSALIELPMDILKLDKSFLDNAMGDCRVQAIVGQIIRMAKLLGLETVAEGVETGKQVEFLREAGCDVAQGYFYEKPIPAGQFEKLISKKEIAQ